MRALTDPIRKQIAERLVHLAPAGALTLETVYEHLVEPPNLELGDLAFACFAMAKVLRTSPAQVAKDLAPKLLDSALFESVQAAGPYLNFKLSLKVFGNELLLDIVQGTYFQRKLTEHSPKTMVEYSQPNTHKELHVGHMRNACLGNAVVRLLRYSGVPVISSTFPGDVGTHVAKCLWYLKYHNQEPLPSIEKGEWLGRIYSKAHLKLEAEEETPQALENKKILTQILHELESGHGEYFDLWKETRQWSLELMKQAYEWADIQFDQWYWESEVDSASVQYVKSLFDQGKLQKSEGAVGMDLSADNLGFCLLLKSDGAGLYATKDLELARRKFQDFQIDQSIYVVDMRQALHFKQVFRTLELLGFAQAKNCFHLQYNFVELPDGAMSSRKGNIVPLMKLVQSMEKMVLEKYLVRYENEWPQAERLKVARQVAQGAIKYGMLKIDNNKKIVFEMEEWLKLDGESGPFIQYSAARINSLCRKLNFGQTQIQELQSRSVDWNILCHKSERNLLQGMMGFHQVVLAASEQYRPSVLCTYLYDLAKRFNLFYHDCSVGQAETEALKQARLALSFGCGQLLQQGLALLGIPTPERM
jgi:arginyl-tRNA synthetase